MCLPHPLSMQLHLKVNGHGEKGLYYTVPTCDLQMEVLVSKYCTFSSLFFIPFIRTAEIEGDGIKVQIQALGSL